MGEASRNRRIAVVLAWIGVLDTGLFPLSGLHKFYLGQPIWGTLYLLLSWTQIPRLACAIEGVWLLAQSDHTFASRWGQSIEAEAFSNSAEQVSAIATALRELDTLRQDGLISEYEFEQKRRGLLDRVG